jgi:hypothetical protein
MNQSRTVITADYLDARLAAVRRLAYEAADSGLLSPDLAAGFARAYTSCMKHLFLAIALCVLLPFTALYGSFSQIAHWKTFRQAQLSDGERKQIIEQIENTSFDSPDSWDTELQIQRTSLGQSAGLIVRGTQLLCGATGSSQTWVFRLSQGKWLNMFAKEAPILSEFKFEQDENQGIKNLLVSSALSANTQQRTLFKFDGKVYRKSDCYEVSQDGGAEKVVHVPCK